MSIPLASKMSAISGSWEVLKNFRQLGKSSKTFGGFNDVHLIEISGYPSGNKNIRVTVSKLAEYPEKFIL